MSKHCKLVTTSLIVALNLASPQAIQGMEVPAQTRVPASGPLKITDVVDGVAHIEESFPTSLATPQAIQGMEELSTEKAEPTLPWDIIMHILVPIVNEHCKRNDPNDKLVNLRCVHGAFNREIDRAKLSWLEVRYGIHDELDKQALRQFANGKLIVELPDGKKMGYKLSNLPNILESSIPSSPHGEANKYLCFNTGYRKGKIEANAGKVEVWFAPRFLLEKTGRHVEVLKGGNKAQHPICILWTNGDWDDGVASCDSLTDATPVQITSKNAFENWCDGAWHRPGEPPYGAAPGDMRARAFHVHFMNQNKRIIDKNPR